MYHGPKYKETREKSYMITTTKIIFIGLKIY